MTVHPDVAADIDSLDTTLQTVEKVIDLDELRRRVDVDESGRSAYVNERQSRLALMEVFY